MNRRSFLKGFLAATAVTALAPTIAPYIPPTPTQMTGAITFEQLEAAYFKLARGAMYPDIMVMSKSQYEAYKRLTA